MLGEDLSARQARGSPTRTHPEQSSAPGGDTAGPGVEGRAPQDAGVEPLEGCRELSVGLGEPPAPKLARSLSLPGGLPSPMFLLSALLPSLCLPPVHKELPFLSPKTLQESTASTEKQVRSSSPASGPSHLF